MVQQTTQTKHEDDLAAVAESFDFVQLALIEINGYDIECAGPAIASRDA